VCASVLVAADGGVFAFGDAVFHGSAGALQLASPIVGISATPTGRGYWLFAADGGIFSYGDAEFRGSMGGSHLNKPVVGGAATPSGNGYWLVAEDGGVFTFGDARFLGAATGAATHAVTGIAPTTSGDGYWVVADDGGVFSFGDAPFLGSVAGATDGHPVVDIDHAEVLDGYFVATGERAPEPVYQAAGGVWFQLRQCESGGNYQANTGNGFYGAYQFTLSTWRSMGTGYAYPHEAPPAVQDDAARRLQARAGWGQWPHCARTLGLR
jgi:hypothetical protein